VEEGGESLTGSLGEATESSSRGGNGGAEVSIRIFGAGEPEQLRVVASPLSRNTGGGGDAAASTSLGSPVSLLPTRVTESENNPGAAAISAEDRVEVAETTAAGGTSANARQEAATSQRYDFQQLARWIEQALPFTILLLMVFIRQHLQGMCCCQFFASHCGVPEHEVPEVLLYPSKCNMSHLVFSNECFSFRCLKEETFTTSIFSRSHQGQHLNNQSILHKKVFSNSRSILQPKDCKIPKDLFNNLINLCSSPGSLTQSIHHRLQITK
jgi:hypothetical protein